MSGNFTRQLRTVVQLGFAAITISWVAPIGAQTIGQRGPVPTQPPQATHGQHTGHRRPTPRQLPKLNASRLIGQLSPGRILGRQTQGAAPQATANPQTAAVHDPNVSVASHLTATDDASIVSPASYAECDAIGCDSIGSPGVSGLQLWGSIDYLMWWQQDADLPVLATSSAPGTIRDEAGVLGFDSTINLFDDDSVGNDSLDGVRLTLGMWVAGGQQTGLFGRWTSVDGYDERFVSVANGDDILGRPFFNVLTDEQDALLLGFPNELEGNMTLDLKSETESFQVLVRQLYKTGCNYRIDLVYGYRNMKHDEMLRINNSLEFTDPAAGTFGTTIDQFDDFNIENEFHGGEFGLLGHSSDGNWTMDFLATIALGKMDQQARIAGSTVTTAASGATFTADGGLLTQTSNLGTHEDDPFTVVPEIAVKLGYYVTPRFDLSVGYTFLYASNILRLENVLDTGVNLNQQTGVPGGPARPSANFNDGSFWVQGLSFGANLRY